MRGVSQVEPSATVVVTLIWPFGRSLLSESWASAMAMEKGDVEALLERADLAADRRLAKVQRLARMGEAAGLGHGMEDAQLVPVHHRRSIIPSASRPPALKPSSLTQRRRRL